MNNNIQPFLKWAGGKRQLINSINKLIPKDIDKYYEPFLGGGAILFNLQPQKAILNDMNSELILTYNVIKDNPTELIKDLRTHINTSEYFYMIRNMDRTDEYNELSDIRKASRLIYLNKTCYNGLFRVNSNGEFNTPFGNYKNPKIVNEEVINDVSEYLRNNDITFMNVDFADALIDIERGSFVYFDPPYYPMSRSSSFTGYTNNGFKKEDHIRLYELCRELDNIGVKFLLSNSNSPFTIDLFKEFSICEVEVKRNINSVAKSRSGTSEIMIRNY